jgi:hypothetical protein
LLITGTYSGSNNTLNGNTAVLKSMQANTNVRTATINGNSLTIVLNSNADYPGTYIATKTGS